MLDIYSQILESTTSANEFTSIVGYAISAIGSVVATVYAMKGKIDILETKLTEANSKIIQMQRELDEIHEVATQLRIEVGQLVTLFQAQNNKK